MAVMGVDTATLALLAVCVLKGVTSQQGFSQEANVTCLTLQSTYQLHFTLLKNSDTIALVYTLNASDYLDTSIGQFDSNGNGIQGNGSYTDPFTITITGNWSVDTGVTLSSEDELVKRVYPIGTDSIRIHVMAKSIYDPVFQEKVLFPTDKIYALTCNFSETYNFLVNTGGLSVSGSANENPTLINDIAQLQIMDNATDTPQDTVALGQAIYLQVSIANPSFATGIYAHSCQICDNPSCSGIITLPVIDDKGCSSSGIVPVFQGIGGGVARTDSFQSFLLNNQPLMYFQCRVNFCYSSSNTLCLNLCTANSGKKRKREVSITEPGPDELLTVQLTIVTSADGQVIDISGPGSAAESARNAAAAKQAEQQNVALVSSVAAVAGVAAVLVTGAAVWFCRQPSKPSLLG